MSSRSRLAALVVGMLALVPMLLAARPAEQGKGPTPLRLIVFFHYPPLVAAQERGYFAAENLAVSWEITPSSTVQMQGLTAGRWDLAITAFDNVLASATREGVPSVAFAVADVRNLPLLVRPEIESYADLHGRPLAADAVDTALALVLRRLLLAQGLDYARGDYELVAVGGNPERLESLRRGETYGAMVLPPLDGAARAEGMRQLGHHSEVLPDYPGSSMTATAAWLSVPANRDAAVRFLRAWLRGVAWSTDPANRAAVIELLTRTQNITASAAGDLLDGVARDIAPNPAGFASVRDLRVELGLVPPPGPPVEPHYDLTIYEQARRSLP